MFDKFFDLFKVKVKKPDMKEFVERIKQGQKSDPVSAMKPTPNVAPDHAARMRKLIEEKTAKKPSRPAQRSSAPPIPPSFYRGSGYNSNSSPYNNSGNYNNSGMSMGEMIAAGLIIENLVDNNSNNSCDNSSSYDNSSSSCDNSSSSSDYSSSSDSSSSCDSSSSSDCGSSGGDSGSW